ncbi:MAG: isoprenylcysteine carboxylmethyltransferase family protein [Nitrospirae bacterium]|nr:isoprenylcysteine carboxylmethyltransferase family protein [Nitrospirota bacterium]
MKTIIYTALYLLLASVAAYISVVYLGMKGIGIAISLIITGFALVGASAFTAAYSRWWGEKGGQRATIILRNLLGIPLWITGFVLAWIEPYPLLFNPGMTLKLTGLFLIILGSIPFIWGHIELGWRTHMPSVKDTLVRHGLYAHVRHPIYSGGFALFIGLALMRLTPAFVLACILGFIWLIFQARLEEIDLIQRMPDYKDYMKQVPRFIPCLRR